jgi:GDPmannose 4,6-dehydratase
MRGEEFVTRKITKHFASLLTKKTDKPLELGNLDSKRDWGFAGDYVEAMWLMMQQDKPDTYVVATGETHSIREFIEETGKICGFNIEWQGEKEQEEGIDRRTGKIIVKVNPRFYRPAEVDLLVGSHKKAREILGWKPRTNYKELCGMMVQSDIEKAIKRD